MNTIISHDHLQIIGTMSFLHYLVVGCNAKDIITTVW